MKYVDVEFNNMCGSELGIFMTGHKTIPSAQENLREIAVPGRDGVLLIRSGKYQSSQILIEFNYIGKEELWDDRWRKAKKWLSAINSELRFSDDPGFFYKVSRVEVGENVKKSSKVGCFTAMFITKDGLSYYTSGRNAIDASEIFYNPGITTNPIFRIKGEGMCSVSVNGKTVKVNVMRNVTIDTEKMLAYKDDGTLQNTAIVGDYEDLYLQEGENAITVTSGFECKVIPNWRCL